ncbi:hypothetical protein K501DRAFT_266934 [Backusella circina FSU 941]|nr:hypothetical protein K501DRAFT_266934 [Backusella circina FSU 941]
MVTSHNIRAGWFHLIWCHVLRRCSLLYGIEILSRDSVDKFIDLIQRLPSCVSQVVILSINYLNWYIYMAKKYTDLTNLQFKDRFLYEVNLTQRTILYRDGILPLYKNIEKHLYCSHVDNGPPELKVSNRLDAFGC